ncbi:MAG: general secretion pathway protein GspK [Candidatus Hydrogenedentes bacterium]|nr:general secretion pathway protein GspK [Candidatus Hydrogenedentota bacterium]
MRNSSQGFALVCVLWVLAILTVITISYGHRAMLDRRAAAYSLDYLQAMQMARGAVERGIVAMRHKASVDAAARASRRSTREPWRFDTVDLLAERRFYSLSGGQELEGEECTYRLRDEERRISLNKSPKEVLDEIDDLSFTVVNEIIDRRREGTISGRPSLFVAVEELLNLDDVSESTWYGDESRPGLRDLLTPWGDGRINLNTASADVLRCIPNVRGDLVDEIVAYRAGPDGKPDTADDQVFSSLGEISGVVNASADDMKQLEPYCKLDSQFFTITGTATQRQKRVRAICSALVRIEAENFEVLQWREGDFGS